jgi:hypothetical protein
MLRYSTRLIVAGSTLTVCLPLTEFFRPTASGVYISIFFLETFRLRCSGTTRNFNCCRSARPSGNLCGPVRHALLTWPSQGTPLYERVVFECDSLRQFYEQVIAAACLRDVPPITRIVQLFPALSDAYPVHYPAASCTWDVFLWLRCLFDSRAFHLKSKGGCLMPSLLPGADMFNYRSSVCAAPLP